MNSKQSISVAIVCFVFISNCIAASELPYKEGELLIRFAPKTQGLQRTKEEKNQLLSSLNAGEVKQSFKRVSGLTLVKLPEGQTVAETLSKFRGRSEILYVEPNYKYKLLSTFPNDPRGPNPDGGELWGMHNIGQTGGTADADIDAPQAWDIITDSDVIVAVLDTGIDYTHPDLAANMWKNQAELNGITGFDDDDNGYVDDIYGWDFFYTDEDPMDYVGHGTHVAGIIGAVGDNGVGVTGVCWNVKLMNLKIGMDDDIYVSVDAAINAIAYAIDKGAKILNNSWGGYEYSQSLKDAVDEANENGVIFIAAAGDEGNNNDFIPAYPTSYDCNNIISVMATNHNDQIASYSNYGTTTVDLAAPGGERYYEGDPGGILSTLPGGGYGFARGTSMAAPYVAGACALVWAANPNLTHLQVKNTILQSADKLTSLIFKCVTDGRLNLFNAVNTAIRPIYLAQTDNAPAGGVRPGDRLTYTINYNFNGPDSAQTLTNVVLTDQLPAEVLDTSVVPSGGGSYNSTAHTVTWNLGTLSHGATGSVTVTVSVGSPAASSWLLNKVKITANEAAENTVNRLTWWYKVHNVTKNQWYSTIQSAIDEAGNNDVIVTYPGIYFETVNFAGKTLTLQSSDPADSLVVAYTVIDKVANFGLVTLTGNSTLNGFTITNPADSTNLRFWGVNCSGSAPTIKNCVIRDGGDMGIRCSGSSAATISNCIIKDYRYGISCESLGPTTITNNWIFNNDGYGIYAQSSPQADIANNVIFENEGTGIYVYSSTNINITNNLVYRNQGDGIGIDFVGSPKIRNNTVVYNTGYGIFKYGGSTPDVNSNIIWGNTYDSLANFGTIPIYYNCIQNGWVYGKGNIGDDPLDDPLFVDADANDFHLASKNSPCFNTGDPNFTSSTEKDIDGEDRVMGQFGMERVDMGADELGCLLSNDPGYSYWKFLGKPKCWCYRRQCRGDSNGSMTSNKPVLGSDLINFQAGFNLRYTQMIGKVDINGIPLICGDYNHSATSNKPVIGSDLTIFQTYFNLRITQGVTQCPGTYINFWTN